MTAILFLFVRRAGQTPHMQLPASVPLTTFVLSTMCSGYANARTTFTTSWSVTAQDHFGPEQASLLSSVAEGRRFPARLESLNYVVSHRKLEGPLLPGGSNAGEAFHVAKLVALQSYAPDGTVCLCLLLLQRVTLHVFVGPFPSTFSIVFHAQVAGVLVPAPFPGMSFVA